MNCAPRFAEPSPWYSVFISSMILVGIPEFPPSGSTRVIVALVFHYSPTAAKPNQQPRASLCFRVHSELRLQFSGILRAIWEKGRRTALS